MLDFLKLFAHVLASPFKSQARLEAEIVVLRQQLMVLRRRVPSKPKPTAVDRLLFVWLYRLFPSILMLSRSSSPRLSCVGTGRAFGCTGAGNHAPVAVGQGFQQRSGG
jgi:hypothetical protein